MNFVIKKTQSKQTFVSLQFETFIVDERNVAKTSNARVDAKVLRLKKNIKIAAELCVFYFNNSISGTHLSRTERHQACVTSERTALYFANKLSKLRVRATAVVDLQHVLFVLLHAICFRFRVVIVAVVLFDDDVTILTAVCLLKLRQLFPSFLKSKSNFKIQNV